MAQFVKNYVQDLAQDIQIRHCGTLIFNTDSDSNVINVALYNGQEEATQSGSVACAVICSDGSTVPVTGGTISGNTVSVTLGADGLIPGQVGIGIQVISGDVKTTVFKAVYSVELFETDTVVDPSSRITISVGELVSDIEAAVASIPADYSDLLAAIAPTFSTSTAYASGSYVWYSGHLYRFTANHAAGAWVGTDAVQVALADDVSDLKSAIDNGYISITSSDLEAGGWDESGNKTTAGRVIRTKRAYPVKAGDYIETVPGATTLYWNGMVISNGVVVDSWASNSSRWSIKNEKRVFAADGNLVLVFANGYNYGNSSSIVPDDMTATVNLYTSDLAKTVKENSAAINSIQQDTQYIFTKKVDETETASSATFFYLPCQFEYGQTYVAKVTFSKFSSSSNRKYSLRTTTYQATSPAYTVQIVATVDGTAPVIGETYEYRFVADKRESGAIATFLVLEMSVNAESVCHVETYSIKAEDNAHEISKLDYLTATDIVSLNHDAPLKILNGLKPFGRATTVPFALLHFSDIHAAQTNLERLVQMGESLGTNIDDVICTGDMVSNNYSATCMDFWDAVDGAENILMVVGNHDLADGSHGYSSDQIGQTVAYQTYFAPYISNWGVTMAGENLTYWYKDYASKKVRLIGLNYLLTGDASAAQKTWLAARLAEAKTAGLTVVIAEHSPLNSFVEIPCNFDIIGKAWGYNEILADIQSAVQDFIDDGGEFACYIAGHSHSDYVGYNSNYPDQLCIVVTTALTSGLDNDQRRVAGEKSQDAANVVLVDTVTKTVKLVRIGADMDTYLRGRNLMTIRYTDKTIIAQS